MCLHQRFKMLLILKSSGLFYINAKLGSYRMLHRHICTTGVFRLTGHTIMVCCDWLRHEGVNEKVPYFLLLTYYLTMTLTLILTQNYPHGA